MVTLPLAQRDPVPREMSVPVPVPLFWPPPPEELRLDDDEIHVWCASTDVKGDLPRLDAVLSADERARAGRFLRGRDRDRFIARRGILRQLLARYLRRDAASIEFSYGPFGKPDVVALEGEPPLFFNASHTSTLAIYAISRACAVGVDVERVRAVPGLEMIASRFLAAWSVGLLTLLPPVRRGEVLIRRWTDLEAWLKATGEGWTAEALTRKGGRIPASWRLRRLRPAPGHVGAVAYRGAEARLSCFGLATALTDATTTCEFTMNGVS